MRIPAYCMDWVAVPPPDPQPRFVQGIVECSVLTYRLRPTSDCLGLYVIFLEEGAWFYAKMPPRLYDAEGHSLPLQELPVGSSVKLCLDWDDWITAIQVLSFGRDCPF